MGNQIEKNTYTNNSYDCAVVANQGERRSMQDRNVVCLSLPSHSEYALFGIFDGFNGHDASTYLAQNLLTELDKLDNLDDDNLIISTLHKMDHNWIKSVYKQENSDRNAGSTVVFALVKQNQPQSNNTTQEHIIRVFWAGDSRAVVMTQKEENMFKTHNLTVDHHCDLEGEATRINNANGEVINNRIDGKVEITRSFGCHVMKNNMDLLQTQQKMISTLECKRFVCKTNDILLLFCDGLIAGNWSNEKLVENYKHNYMQHRDEKNGLLNCLIYLADQAIDEGSKDNISVISVQFKDNSDDTNINIAESSPNIYHRFYKNENRKHKLEVVDESINKGLHIEVIHASNEETNDLLMNDEEDDDDDILEINAITKEKVKCNNSNYDKLNDSSPTEKRKVNDNMNNECNIPYKFIIPILCTAIVAIVILILAIY